MPNNSLSSPSEVVQIDDEAIVTKRDGSTVSFTVESIETDSISGQGQQVFYSDIDELKIRRSSRAATITLAVAAAGLVWIFIAGKSIQDDLESLIKQ